MDECKKTVMEELKNEERKREMESHASLRGQDHTNAITSSTGRRTFCGQLPSVG